MLSRTALLILATALPFSGVSAQAGRAYVDQVGKSRTPSATTIQPIGNVRSSSAEQVEAEMKAAPAVPPELIEACRTAQQEDRTAPEGVDCTQVLEAASGAAPAEPSAEGSLLQLFGGSSSVTEVSASRRASATDADAVAREISSGDVEAGSGAAAVVARERAAPPPDGPRPE